MAPLTLGYARVSKRDQNPDLQLDALRAAGCDRIFEEKASGASRDGRTELDRALEQLREGDVLVVWKLDRLGRSLSDLVAIANDLADRGVGFRCLDRGLIDTTTAAGTVIFQIFGAFAQYEREQMLERTIAGLQAARARGRAGGRPTVMTPAKRAAAQQMFDARQHTVEAIATALGVSRTTVYRNIDTRPPSERTESAA